MKTLVIYDSYFGNTQKIAEVISHNIPSSKLKNVKDFTKEDLKDIELLIVGSPTRAFNPSEKTTSLLNSLSKGSLENIKVAAFDTRIDLEKAPNRLIQFFGKIFGFAAKPILKKLVKKGGKPTLEPIGFYVKETEGPLEDDAIQQAKDWVAPIAS